ncbi:MAG TPA: hypothetical protein VGQ39_06320 [Pyrinomonadaceae bacterium]|jgi:hypothetical protein|nr:hypothetical protein [Pyrinomonadaceae bacterium]
MDAPDRKRWVRAVILLGSLYFVVNFICAALAGRAASNSMRFTWNRLGFIVSAIAFGTHISYEHFRLRNSPRVTACTRPSCCPGCFRSGSLGKHSWSLGGFKQPAITRFALVAWPALTGIPAFVVAFAAAAGLSLKRPRI